MTATPHPTPSLSQDGELRAKIEHLIDCAKKGDATYAVANAVLQLIAQECEAVRKSEREFMLATMYQLTENIMEALTPPHKDQPHAKNNTNV